MIGPLTNFEKVQEFHEATGAERNSWPPSSQLAALREGLVYEEYNELLEELNPAIYRKGPLDKKKVAKEIADVLYVAYGTADAFGIDIDRVFEEVHRSNMSKLVDGKPLKREDGKILKGPNYTPPNLDFIKE